MKSLDCQEKSFVFGTTDDSLYQKHISCDVPYSTHFNNRIFFQSYISVNLVREGQFKTTFKG